MQELPLSRRRAPAAPWLRLLRGNVPLLLFLLLGAGGMVAVHAYYSPARDDAETVLMVNSGLSRQAPINKPAPQRPILQRLPQSQAPVRIGLIIGHYNYDSGAVCEDGLTEVQVNLNIVSEVAKQLTEAGITSELLAEFDPRLNGYNGTALVSVHADSCDYFSDDATGFKIAASAFTDSSQLEECVERHYAAATQMSYHANTITPHMTDYHAFRAIAPGVPAIIVESGFMNRDREMLTNNAIVPATGLAKGILCFLESG